MLYNRQQHLRRRQQQMLADAERGESRSTSRDRVGCHLITDLTLIIAVPVFYRVAGLADMPASRPFHGQLRLSCA